MTRLFLPLMLLLAPFALLVCGWFATDWLCHRLGLYPPISTEPVHRVDYLPHCCPARAGESWVCVDEAGVREERIER